MMASRQVIDISRLVDEQTIGPFNVKIVILSFLIMLADGYDLQAASLAGPGLVQSWQVNPSALGLVFSASLFGMLFGGPFFGYVGDRYGRRSAILAASLAYSIVTLVAAYAASLNELIVLRFLTGLGLGGLPANCIALNAEYAPKRVRATLTTLMYLGITVGTMLPAGATAILGQSYRWQTLFLIGGLAPLPIIGLIFLFLPESIKFLALRNRSRARIAKLAATLKPGLSVAPDAEFRISDGGDKGIERSGVKRLFTDGFGGITLAIWTVYIMVLMANYFLHSWIPILIRAEGLSIREMGLVTTMLGWGGIAGALVAGFLLDKRGFITLVGFFVLACPFTAIIGWPGLSVILLSAAVFAAGFFMIGIAVGMSSAMGIIYPTPIRANGAGWALAIGRFGAILGPLVGAWLIAAQLSVQQLFLAPVVPMAIGAFAAYALMRLCDGRFGNRHRDEVAAVRLSLDATD